MRFFKRIRVLDALIVVVAALVVLTGSYLAWAVWDHDRAVLESTAPGRELASLLPQLKKSPKDVGLRMQIAQDYAVLKKYDEAIEQYEEVLSLKKNFVPALAGLGFVALEREEYKTAEGYFQRVVDLYEGEGVENKSDELETSYFYLGSALIEQKKYEEAASNLKKALLIRRDASDTHYMLAVCFRELDSMQSYRESLENCLMFDPKHPEANYDLAMLLLEEGDDATAAEHLRVAAESAVNKDKPLEALEEFGTFKSRYAAAKKLAATDAAKALIEARIAVALAPRSIDGLLLIGELYEKAGNATAAETAYRRVLTIDAENTMAADALERMTDGS